MQLQTPMWTGQGDHIINRKQLCFCLILRKTQPLLLRDQSYPKAGRAPPDPKAPSPSPAVPSAPGLLTSPLDLNGAVSFILTQNRVAKRSETPAVLPALPAGLAAEHRPRTGTPRQQGKGRADSHGRSPALGPAQSCPVSRSSSGPGRFPGSPADAERGSGIELGFRPGSRRRRARGEGTQPGRFPEESAASSSPIAAGTHPWQDRTGQDSPAPLRSSRAAPRGAAAAAAPAPSGQALVPAERPAPAAQLTRLLAARGG